jgi:hypothetical protein
MGILGIASFFIPKTIPVGFSQRIGMGAYFLWLFVMGLALLSKQQKLLPERPARRTGTIGQY